MNYTTNYHLPQWVEEDRIMMGDFNEAMTNIDQSIAEEAASQAEAIASLEQSTGQAQGQLKADFLDRMRRSGYDLYQVAGRGARADLFQFPAKGMIINTLHTKDELARAGECIHLEDGGIQIGPSTKLSLQKINAAAYDWVVGNAGEVAQSATASVKFHSTFQGTITKLNVWYHRTSVTATTQLSLYVQLYDQDTGSQVYRSSKITSKVLSAVDTTETLTVAVPIKLNHTYRLELFSGGTVFSGSIGFGTMGVEALTGEVSAQAINKCTISDSITLDTEAKQAVAVVHYGGGSKIPSVTLNGQALTAKEPKTATALDGTSCTELEFFLEGSFTGKQTLVTTMQSSSDMTILDTGAYFV